ncbi:hypothetical protein NQ317_019023 [Molorchus minor]|uniref:FLYWCH-type domain-containing protein n=1 Tax=Molorchus minor TaxID=1323400 RepID=A0ABQ9IUD6_9CUCU|nr:hypothetical protein NQ317_019023 [Molorchus minor]
MNKIKFGYFFEVLRVFVENLLGHANIKIYFDRSKKTNFPKIILNKNEYVINRRMQNRTFWICGSYRKTKCKARVATTGNLAKVSGTHNHQPNALHCNLNKLTSYNVVANKKSDRQIPFHSSTKQYVGKIKIMFLTIATFGILYFQQSKNRRSANIIFNGNSYAINSKQQGKNGVDMYFIQKNEIIAYLKADPGQLSIRIKHIVVGQLTAVVTAPKSRSSAGWFSLQFNIEETGSKLVKVVLKKTCLSGVKNCGISCGSGTDIVLKLLA